MTMPPSSTSTKTLPRMTVMTCPAGAHHAGQRQHGDGQRGVVQAEGGDAQEGQRVGDIADDGLQGLDEDHQHLLADRRVQVAPGVPGERRQAELISSIGGTEAAAAAEVQPPQTSAR
jgi:hypothetical protein